MKQHTVTATYQSEGEWLVLWADGSVSLAGSPKQILRKVAAFDARLSEKLDEDVTTMLNWMNVPENFLPPEQVR